MPRWVLHCKQCNEELTHSQISANVASILDPFALEIKPNSLKLV